MAKWTEGIFVSLIILSAGAVLAQEGDRQHSARPVLVEQGIENAYPRWSADGTEILFQSNKTGQWQIYLMDADGSNIRQITSHDSNNNYPHWTADNEWLAFVSDRSGNEDVWVMRMDGSGLRQLTTDPDRDIHPYWTPDGSRVLFNSFRDGNFEVYSVTPDGASLKRLTKTDNHETCARLSPAGDDIVYLINRAEGSDEIFAMNAEGDSVRNISQSESAEGWPTWTPDGERVIYASTWHGVYSLYSRAADGTDQRRLTYPEKPWFDARPDISADGSKIVFNRQDTTGTIAIYVLELE